MGLALASDLGVFLHVTVLLSQYILCDCLTYDSQPVSERARSELAREWMGQDPIGRFTPESEFARSEKACYPYLYDVR